MNKYAYILVFDRDDNLDYVAIHKQITELPFLLNWFHYIRSSYILMTSEQSIHQLNEKVRGVLGPDKHILLMKVSLENGNYDGWLPQDAWDWIREQNEDMKI
jgi:hypothetical protein